MLQWLRHADYKTQIAIVTVAVLALIFIIFAVIGWINRLVNDDYEPSKKKSPWDNIDSRLILVMQKQLGPEYNDFKRVCTKIGLVNNFIAISRETNILDGDSLSFFCAGSIVSAANYYGMHSELATAKLLAEWAVKINPLHILGLICLATIFEMEGDEESAYACYRKIEKIK